MNIAETQEGWVWDVLFIWQNRTVKTALMSSPTVCCERRSPPEKKTKQTYFLTPTSTDVALVSRAKFSYVASYKACSIWSNIPWAYHHCADTEGPPGSRCCPSDSRSRQSWSWLSRAARTCPWQSPPSGPSSSGSGRRGKPEMSGQSKGEPFFCQHYTQQ